MSVRWERFCSDTARTRIERPACPVNLQLQQLHSARVIYTAFLGQCQRPAKIQIFDNNATTCKPHVSTA